MDSSSPIKNVKITFQNEENLLIVDNVMLENNHLLLEKIKMVTNTKAVCQFLLKNILI